MTHPVGGESALQRAAARQELWEASERCAELRALLPREQPWAGLASQAFRLRVATLSERLETAAAALAAAQGML